MMTKLELQKIIALKFW